MSERDFAVTYGPTGPDDRICPRSGLYYDAYPGCDPCMVFLEQDGIACDGCDYYRALKRDHEGVL